MEPEDIAQSFLILRKCQNKFDSLIFEMFFIRELKPALNKQCDSIRAKLFVKSNSLFYFSTAYSEHFFNTHICYHILAFAIFCLL